MWPRSIIETRQRPLYEGDCWASKRIPRHNALGFASNGPAYAPCSRRSRSGCLTCWQHQHLEETAIHLAKRLAAKEDDR